MSSYTTKRVVICADGAFDPEIYRDLVRTMERHLKQALHPGEVGKPRVPVATVEVVEIKDEVAAKVKKGEVDVVIFVSASMMGAACTIRVHNPHIQVIVLTGTNVNGEPFIVPKRILTSGDNIVALVNAM